MTDTNGDGLIVPPQIRLKRRPKTVQQVADIFLANAIDDLAPGRRYSYRYTLKLFCAACGPKKLTECGPLDLARFIKSMPSWKSFSTRKGAVNMIQRVFNWSVWARIIATNPVRGVSHQDGDPRDAMSQADFRALLRASDVIFRWVLFFCRWTGCRPYEFYRLRWKDVDFDRGVATLWQHKSRKTQRKPKPRILYLVPPLVRLLQWTKAHPGYGRRWNLYPERTREAAILLQKLLRNGPRPARDVIRRLRFEFDGISDRIIYLAKKLASVEDVKARPDRVRYYNVADGAKPVVPVQRPGSADDDLVFTTGRGTAWTNSNLSNRMRRLRVRAKITGPCVLYGLRHAMVTGAILNQVPLKIAAELAGHSNTKITERYVHIAGLVGPLRDAAVQAVGLSQVKASPNDHVVRRRLKGLVTGRPTAPPIPPKGD